MVFIRGWPDCTSRHSVCYGRKAACVLSSSQVIYASLCFPLPSVRIKLYS